MKLPKYSMGIGDRFARQGIAQLQAMVQARLKDVLIAPVWNKSFREHQIIGTEPGSVRIEADTAVTESGWTDPYFVDADHISLKTVDGFIEPCDFFTLDVADSIGKPADPADIDRFLLTTANLSGLLEIPGLPVPITVTRDFVRFTAEKYLSAVQEAGAIYRYLMQKKNGPFVTEVSMDETDSPQTPEELLIILAMIHREGIPVQTIAPKFSGRFNKGVEYVGDVRQFALEFQSDLAVIRYAVERFNLPDNLKLSVHSGSDKFSLYPVMREAVRQYDTGLHLKTAGTTWLEELVGLAESEGNGLAIAKSVYRQAYQRFDELCTPYATVIDIDRKQLPTPETVNTWTGTLFADTLRHNPLHPSFNAHFRQLLHVGYKVAAEMGSQYIRALEENQDIVGKHVTQNLFERHIQPLFL